MGVPVATTVPSDELRGCGGFSLRGPVGGRAYGIPLKESMPPEVEPITVAESRTTDGDVLFPIPGAASATFARQNPKLIENLIAATMESEVNRIQQTTAENMGSCTST